MNEKFQILKNTDESKVEVQRGDDVELLCPTNHNSNNQKDRPRQFLFIF